MTKDFLISLLTAGGVGSLLTLVVKHWFSREDDRLTTVRGYLTLQSDTIQQLTERVKVLEEDLDSMRSKLKECLDRAD